MTGKDHTDAPVALQNNPDLQRMVRRFKGAGAKRHEFDIGDGGEPMVFYSHPMSWDDTAKLQEMMDIDPGLAFVDTIIRKARTEDDKPFFAPDAGKWLRESVDTGLISKMFAAVNRGVPTAEDLAGNSEATQDDSTS